MVVPSGPSTGVPYPVDDDGPKCVTAFAMQYRRDLARWGETLARHSGEIVAISRKGPRLLQLAAAEGLVPQSLLDRVTTERGMSLAATEGRRYVVVDDVLLFGSTFSRVRNHAQLLSRAPVPGFPFAMSDGADEEYRTAVTASFLKLSKDNAAGFLSSEVSAFAALGVPYDVEHPILSFRLVESNANDVESLLREVAGRQGHDLFRTDRRYSDCHGNRMVARAWTLLIPVSTTSHERAQFTKLRIYMSPMSSRLVVVPISPTTDTLRGLRRRIAQSDPLLQQAFALPTRPGTLAVDDPDFEKARMQSEVAWANYLLESQMLRPNVDELARQLQAAHLLEDAPAGIDRFDIALLVGGEAADRASEAVAAFWREEPTSLQLPLDIPSSHLLDTTANIPLERLGSFESLVGSTVRRGQTDRDVIALSFLAQRKEIELPSRESRDPARLEFGVPFRYLAQLVRGSRHQEVKHRSAHQALDALIDVGLIVPRYLSQATPDGELWYRGFRVGESPDVLASAVLEITDALATALGTDDLPEVVTEKYFVILMSHLRLFDATELSSALPVERSWYLYGARMEVVDRARRTPLASWAISYGVLRKRKVQAEWKYSINPAARGLIGDRILLPPTRSFVNAVAAWTADARLKPGLGSRFLRMIATAESENAYCHALQAELAGWLHGPYSVKDVFQSLIEFDAAIRGGRPVSTRDAAALERNANWSAQAIEKVEDYADRAHLYSTARAAWPTKGNGDINVRDFWNATLQHHIDLDDPSLFAATAVLEQSAHIMRTATTLLRNVAAEWTDSSDRRRKPLDDAAADLIAATADANWRLACRLRPAAQRLDRVKPDVPHDLLLAELRLIIAAYVEALDWALQWTRGDGSEPPSSVRDTYLRDLRTELISLGNEADRSSAGVALNRWLFDLCDLFGLRPFGSYEVPGQEIDGGFYLGGHTYIVEAKWLKGPATQDDLRSFYVKALSKPASTRAVFVSMTGYVEGAAQNLLHGLPARFLMLDGGHIGSVTNSTRDLGRLTSESYERFERTSNPYEPSHAARTGALRRLETLKSIL